MTVASLALVAFASLGLNGLTVALAVHYRQNLKRQLDRVKAMRADLTATLATNDRLSAELRWSEELRTAQRDAVQLLADVPLPRRGDPLEQLYHGPAFGEADQP